MVGTVLFLSFLLHVLLSSSFLLHVLQLCFILFYRVCASQQNLKPTTTKKEPTRTCKSHHQQQPPQTHRNTHKYATNAHTTQQYLGRAEGSPTCPTSLRASGHPAIRGGGQRARVKAIEARGQGGIFEFLLPPGFVYVLGWFR